MVSAAHKVPLLQMGANCIRRAFEVGHNIKGEGWREPRSNLQRNYGGGIRRACDRHEVVWRGRAGGGGALRGVLTGGGGGGGGAGEWT